MGYVFLFLAVFCDLAKGFGGKKVSKYTHRLSDTTLVCFLRMIFCVAIGSVIVLAESNVPFGDLSLPMLLTSALSGISFAVLVATWLLAVRSGTYVMLDVSATVGMGVTIALCAIFFGEDIRLIQIIGFAVILIAVYIICSYSISLYGKMSVGQIFTVIIYGISNGLADFSQKLFVYKVGGSNAAFNFYTYIISALILLAVWAFIKRKESRTVQICGSESSSQEVSENSKKPFLTPKVVLLVLMMSVFLFFYSYFKTQAAATLDAVILYPLFQVSTLILGPIMAAIFFKEKITLRCIIGISLTFVAMLMINFL